MSGTRFAYVKAYETPDQLLPNTFIVCRIDGRAFSRFTEVHCFTKPNDERGLRLMDCAAKIVMEEFRDVVLAFGQSDEFSFLLRRTTVLYNRRSSKILSTLVSTFTAAYIFHWPMFFPHARLKYPPTFDARIVLYPSSREVRDYFAWRQADTHINNLYNTCFWALIKQGGQTPTEAHETLRGTGSNQKHEMLFSRFGINYNNIDARYRKGSVLVRECQELEEEVARDIAELGLTTSTPSEDIHFTDPNPMKPLTSPKTPNTPSVFAKSIKSPNTMSSSKSLSQKKAKSVVRVIHDDLIREDFWIEHEDVTSEGP